MNEMELLRELARETPLPARAELGGARARLVAAITTDPAAHATRPGQELGAHRVHGAVRPGDAGTAFGARGNPRSRRRAGVLRRTDLAVRLGCDVDAVAPGLQRVLQVRQGGAVAAAIADFRPLTAMTLPVSREMRSQPAGQVRAQRGMGLGTGYLARVALSH